MGNTSAQIIKYTPFMPMTAYVEHNSYSFEGNTEFSSIIYNDNQVSETGKMVTDCRNLYGFRCTGRNGTSGACGAPAHIPRGECTTWTPDCIVYTFITQSCTTYDDGTGDETGGFSPGGGSSYNTGGGNNPVYSDPVCTNCFEGTPDDIDTDACNELKKMSKNESVSDALKDAKTFATTSDVERGSLQLKKMLH